MYAANDHKHLIFCAYAQDSKMRSGANVQKISDTQSLYLKNAIVALVSAKASNPACEVMLVTNVQVSSVYSDLLAKHSISTVIAEFDSFRFDEQYHWGLAFYKLCALKYLLDHTQYDNYLLLDLDTFTQSELDDLWREAEHNIMLYDINHRLTIPDCAAFNDEVDSFMGKSRALTNYGGEFIAGNHELLSTFIAECESVFEQMNRLNFRTAFGDEFIIRIAADRLRPCVKNAGGYIHRFWTGTFRLMSTCYHFNAVSVLHVPNEKNSGLIRVYNYISKQGKVPLSSRVHGMLHLKRASIETQVKRIAKLLIVWNEHNRT